MADDPCIPRQSHQEIYDCIISNYRSMVLRGRPVLNTDPMHAIAAVMSDSIYKVQLDFERRLKSYSLISEMCCDQLDAFAQQINQPRNPASTAQGFVQLNGAAGATIPVDFTVTSNSQTYVLDPLVTNATSLNSDGTATVLMRASEPGAAGNIIGQSGVLLGISTVSAGIGSAAVLGEISGGAEEETCEEHRARLQQTRRIAATIGNKAWFEETLLRFPGVTRVCSAACNGSASCGGAFQQFYVWMDETYENGIPPISVANDITDWLFGNPQGNGSGQAMIGLQGIIIVPGRAPVGVNINDITGTIVNPTIQEELRLAFDDFFTNRDCDLGPKICQSELFRVANSVLPSGCWSSVTLTGEEVTASDNGRDFTVTAGKFPYLGSLNI